MQRVGRFLVWLVVILLVIVAGLAATGYWFVRRPWPQTQGQVTVAGLTAPVTVVRDRWGVPHLWAENEADLFFAQGYVHAQDRLWQMEFNRRVSSGTLSEVLGDATLSTDRFLRTIGLRRAAQEEWEATDAETRAIMEAYAAGVNAFIDSHRDRLPLEFTILGFEPEPWSPVDTVAWGKVMSWDLGNNWEMELLRARLIAEFGVEATQELFPTYGTGAPLILPPEVRNYAWLRGASLDGYRQAAAWLGAGGPDVGSNNWVVSGSRTSTGLPLLADDTHLGLNMPSIWYEMGLHGGRFDVVGFTFPGGPLVIIGHNARIAWGVTNLGPDVQDLYLEKLDRRDNPTQYEFMGQMRDLTIVDEVIEIKGTAPETLRVYATHHGPIMNDVVGDLGPDAEPVALQWTAVEPGRLFPSVVGINLATDWETFRQAVSKWDVPSQNFVYADVDGNIGYQAPGRIPIRAAGHTGTVPVPGWTGEYEWQGFIPFEELPSVLNPDQGFVATANNKVAPDDYPFLLTADWAAPFRAQRITDLLAADDSVTPEDIRDIQAQTYSIPAERILPYLLASEPAGSDLEARALAELQAWDLYNEADRSGAAIYQVFYWKLVLNTLGDELGPDLTDSFLDQSNTHIPLLVEMVTQPDSRWFDDVATAEVETRDDILRRSFKDAVAYLAENLGNDPRQWEWGQIHTITFVHNPLGQSGISLLEKIFNSATIPARGSNVTVDAASFDYFAPFAMKRGASQRQIVDLSDWDSSQMIHTTGQSGHAFHPHREDFIELWQNVDYHPMLFSRAAVEANAEGTLVLRPQ